MSSTATATGIDAVSHVSLVVPDQAEAVSWYTEALGLEVRADEPFETPDGATGRWVTVGVPGQDDVEVALVEPDPELYPPESIEELESQIGNVPALVLHTPDCRATVAELESRGVEITEAPVDLPWGVSAMIADPYGNEFNLMEPTAG